MIVYCLFQETGDGYSYGTRELAGVFSTKELANTAMAILVEHQPPFTAIPDIGPFLEYDIHTMELDDLVDVCG